MSKSAFSLLELIVVILIVGVLVAVAVPAYQNYIIRAKTAEAYSIIEKTKKSQVSFYIANGEFFQAEPIPNLVVNIKTVPVSPSWDVLGYPAAPNSTLHFSYRSVAGRKDATGTELNDVSSTFIGNIFLESTYDPLYRRLSNGGSCNTGLGTAANYLTMENSMDWVVITATADLNNSYDPSIMTDTCTSFLMAMQSSPITNKKPSSTGMIVFNYGQ